MRKSQLTVVSLGILTVAASNCASILGLDQFTEGNGAGGGTATSSSTGGAGGGAGDLCSDGKKDGTETGKDCGGPCSPCANGEGCMVGPDCASKTCSAGTCATPSCSDKLKNGSETDVDCGAMCSKCGPAQGCAVDGDCVSGKCTNGACESSCMDMLKGGAETDVDCGGGMISGCPGCANGGACKLNADCASGICRMENCVGSYVWGKHFAAPQGMAVFPNSVLPGRVVVDKSNNILMSAGFSDFADFGAGAVGATGKGGATLTKYDPTGALTWSVVVGNTYPSASPSGFDADASGNTVVSGSFTGSVFFDNVTLTSLGASDLFVAKLDAFGKTLWAKRFGDAKDQHGTDARFDAQGNVVVSGFFYGTIDLGGGVLTSAGGADIFVAKFDPNGMPLWSKRFGSSSDEYVSMVLDAAGDVVLSVDVQNAVDFGGVAQSPYSGGHDVAVAKLDSSGAHLWTRFFGSGLVTDEYGRAVVDKSGNVVLIISGDPSNGPPAPIDLGGGPITNAGVLGKFDPTGMYLWSEGIGAFGSVTADAAGNLIMTGPCAGNVDFGSGVLMCPGASGADVFVAKFDSAGKSTWSRRFGDVQNSQDGLGIGVLEGTGDIALLGQFRGMLDFGGGPIPTATSQDDAFLARLRVP